jgi:hypothetical protein
MIPLISGKTHFDNVSAGIHHRLSTKNGCGIPEKLWWWASLNILPQIMIPIMMIGN